MIARTTGRTSIADLYVDGKPLCRLPCQAMLPSGIHVVAGRGPAAASAEQRIFFAPGTAVPILLDVTPLQAVLRVTAAVPGTLVYLDGVPIGNTSWQGVIAAGRHRLLLRRPSGEQVFQDLTAAAGMTYNIRDNLPARPTTPPARSSTPPALTPTTTAPVQVAPQRPPHGNPSTPNGVTPNYEVQRPAIESPPPIPASPSGESERYRGITGALMVPIILGGPSTNDYGDHCPAIPFGGTCSVSGPRGASILGRIGYAFDWIAPEFTLGLSLDISSGGLHLPNDARIEGDPNGLLTQIAGNTKFLRIGMLGAMGVRIASAGRSSRFSLSGSLGLVKRHVYVLPDSFFGPKPSYTAKTLFFDAGILLGDTPGAKFYAGLFAWLEFVPTLVIERDVTKLGLDKGLVPASLTKVTPFSGTQLLFGPFVGVVFGH